MKSREKDTNLHKVSDEFLERFADLLWQSIQEQSKNGKRELIDKPQILCETYPIIELQNKT